MGFCCPNCNVVFLLKKCVRCGKHKIALVEFDTSPRTHKPLPRCQECRAITLTYPLPIIKTCVICGEGFVGRKWKRTCYEEKCQELWVERKLIKQRTAERVWHILNKDRANAKQRERYKASQEQSKPTEKIVRDIKAKL